MSLGVVLGIGQKLCQRIKHQPNTATAMQLAVGHQPDRDHKRVGIRQNPYHIRGGIPQAVDHRQDTKTLLCQLPCDHSTFWTVPEILITELNPHWCQNLDHPGWIPHADKVVLGHICRGLRLSSFIEVVTAGKKMPWDLVQLAGNQVGLFRLDVADDKKITQENKMKCIDLLKDCDYNFIKGYRELHHLEYFLIRIINLLKNTMGQK